VPDKEKRRKIIKALNHDFRKRLLERVAAGKVTYTELLNLTGVESGYLAYHLRSMGDLLEKSEDGYTLTLLGLEAYSILHGRVETPRSPVTWPRVTAVILFAVILVSVIYFAYTTTQSSAVEAIRLKNRQALRNHTVETMDFIVNAFEYVDVPRSLWTEILVHSALLRQDLEIMQADNDPLIQTPLIRSVDHFMGEATRILSGTDSAYLTLSRENRQLLRDLHYSLFTLKKSLG
jgi:DNA-binding transcriptional ArsR family regulator